MENLKFHLQKSKQDNPWGFRIQGGKDFNRPLIISRITCETIADKGGLKCGDHIAKINDQLTTFLTHNEAQQLIIDSGATINLEILRILPSLKEKSPFNITNPVKLSSSIPSKKSILSAPRTGIASDIQFSHSNFDFKYRSPICGLCNVEIRGPFLIVLDYCFCPNHFNCKNCKTDLTKRTFVEVDGVFYCEEDYSKYFAPKCQKCNNSIVVNEVIAMGCNWHSSCFNCIKCGINLTNNLFRVGDDGLPYCEDDWKEMFQAKCTRCNQRISVLDRFVEIENGVYHAKCFSCSACRISLEGKPFHNRNGKPFCRVHANAGTIF